MSPSLELNFTNPDHDTIKLFADGTWNLDTTESSLLLRPGADLFGGLSTRQRSTEQIGALPISGLTTIDVLSHGTKDIALPLLVQSNAAGDLPAAIGEALRKLDPITGGKIALEYWADGNDDNPFTPSTARTITGYIVAGLSTVVVQSKDSRTALIPAIFRAEVPYWAGPTVTDVPDITTATNNASGILGAVVDGANYDNPYPSSVTSFSDAGAATVTLPDDVVGAWPRFTPDYDGCTIGANVIAISRGAIATTINGVGVYPGIVDTDPSLRALLTDMTPPSIVRPLGAGVNTVTYAVDILSGSGTPSLGITYQPLYLTPE